MNRYIRLDTMWDASAWLIPLSDAAQLVWVKLLCYVKNAGREGRAKALVPLMAARMWNTGEENVRQLLYAAEQHGALSIDGHDWLITKWDQYQGDSTAAARMQRHRANKKSDGVLRVTPVTLRETETETETETEKRKTPKASGRLSPLLLMDSSFQTPELLAAYGKYEQMRKEKKLQLWTKSTVETRATQWAAFEPCQVLSALQKSVSNGWQGVFPDREPTATSAVDDRTRILEKLKAEGYE